MHCLFAQGSFQNVHKSHLSERLAAQTLRVTTEHSKHRPVRITATATSHYPSEGQADDSVGRLQRRRQEICLDTLNPDAGMNDGEVICSSHTHVLLLPTILAPPPPPHPAPPPTPPPLPPPSIFLSPTCPSYRSPCTNSEFIDI